MTFEERDGGVSFKIIVNTRASESNIYGVQGDVLRVRLNSAPVDDKANKECIELISRVFNIAKSNVQIVQGHKSRRKKVHILGTTVERAQHILDEHIL